MLKWIYRGLGLVILLACIVFAVHFLKNYEIYRIFHTLGPNALLFLAAAAAFIATAWSIFTKPSADRKVTVLKGALLAASLAITIGNSYVYVRYLPKFGQESACAQVKADLRFSRTECRREGGFLVWYTIVDNPFVNNGYVLNWESAEGKTGLVFYDPAGRYEYNFDDDITIVTECFATAGKRNIYVSKDYVVNMNLYFNKTGGNPFVMDCMENGKWTDKTELDHSTYEPGLAEGDVGLFLGKLGEEELKKQLDDITQKYLRYYNRMKTEYMPDAAALRMSIKLYGIDIASFQDGDLVISQ